MPRRIAFVNEKGGSCKTTLTVNIGAYFAIFKHKRVLILDLDSQGQVGKSLGIDVKNTEPSMFELLTDDNLNIRDAILSTRIDNLDVVVSNKRMAAFPETVAQDSDREFKLSNKLSFVRNYDYILFDSPPSIGLVTRNIMLATQEIVVPVSLTYLSMDGCAEIVDTIEQIHSQYKRKWPVLTAVVPTLYRATRLANEIVSRLNQHFPQKVSKSILGFNVRIDEAQSHGLTIWEYRANCPGAVMLEGIARHIEQQGR